MSELLDEVARYYASKLDAHGTTPRGVDWNGEAGQLLRFDQLVRIVRGEGAFMLHDLGCGYGALVDHLSARFPDFTYVGWDVSQEMVQAARSLHAAQPRARFE